MNEHLVGGNLYVLVTATTPLLNELLYINGGIPLYLVKTRQHTEQWPKVTAVLAGVYESSSILPEAVNNILQQLQMPHKDRNLGPL